MGTKMGPSYANRFVGYIENQFFNQCNGPKPELYHRYIDDCVCATSSNRGNGLCTSVHYKPTDSHSYLLYSSSHPSHVHHTSRIPFLRRLCIEDSDFFR